MSSRGGRPSTVIVLLNLMIRGRKARKDFDLIEMAQ
jgi:hypothetical protein